MIDVQDDGEVASNLEDAIREAGIKRVASRLKPPKDFDGIHCVECGEPIPQDRLSTGAYTDIECQIAIEAQARKFRCRT